MNTKTSKSNTIDINADLYDDDDAIHDAHTFRIIYDWTPDGEGGGDFTIRKFMLHTGIRTEQRFRSGESRITELTIDMPLAAHDYAEKLLWKKAHHNASFIENL